MQYRIIPASEIENVDLSWWQSSTWADILIDSGQAREVFYFGSVGWSYLLIEIRSVWLGLYGAFSLGVSHSQIGSDWDEYISILQTELQSRDILFLQIEPIDTEIQSANTQKPYKKFLTPYTRVLDLSPSEDEILAQMHEKWRYNIRSALRKWVQVEKAPSTPENLDIWMSLLMDTFSRDRFSGNSRDYYQVFIQKLEKNNQWWLYFARFEGRVVAWGIFVLTPDTAIYYYGASSSSHEDRNIFAPYLLQWELMRIAKSKNIWTYDLLGVSSPTHSQDALAGVSFFKSRFGWKVITLPSKVLYPLSWKYRLFAIVQKIKNLLKTR
jgi:lipid II:glycine glycyltransferase (peptidoglycan interpeptide bridge formation enzyme)